MCSGKDVCRCLPALLVGLTCFGCVVSGSRRPPAAPPLSQGPAGPVVLAEPRPVPATPPAAPTAPVIQRTTAPAPAPSVPSAGIPIAATQQAQPAAVDALADVRRLHRAAAERYAGIGSYIARLRRREQIAGKSMPEEVLSFKFRKQPWSVHFKWLSDPGKDREILHVRGQHDNKIHTRLAAGDSILPAGMRVALATDDPRVLARSRHPITEAGIGAIIDRIGAMLADLEKGDPRRGTLAYLGPQPRSDYPGPDGSPMALEGVEQRIPPGGEQHLPRGGQRLFFFDPATGLPVLILTRDDRGQEVEYYCYDRLLLNVKLDDDDFNPDKLWRKP